MTKDIEWGEVIEVSGRPDWLRDDELCIPCWDGYWYRGQEGGEVKHVTTWHTVNAIKLPADHACYTVARYNAEHGTSFIYWPGGDEEVWRNEEVVLVLNELDGKVKLFGTWGPLPARWRVIGYAKRAEPQVNHAYESRMAERCIENDPSPKQFTPCERTVRMCIDALGFAKVSGYAYSDAMYAEQHKICVDVVKSLLPQPKPDRAEEVYRSLMGEDSQSSEDYYHGFKEAVRRLIERGDIK